MDQTERPKILDAFLLEEGRRWSSVLERATGVAVVAGGLIDVLDVAISPSAARVLLLGRAAAFLGWSGLVLFNRGYPTKSVDSVDDRARALTALLSLVWGVEVGALGRLPYASALLFALAGLFPFAMRRLQPKRWIVGWLTLTLAASLGLLLAGSGPSRSGGLAIAAALTTHIGFYLLARTFSSQPRLGAEALGRAMVGRYELIRRIGKGGMGEVWEARHPALKGHVALKLLSLETPSARQRFENEARVTAQLSHPNTVRIFDYGLAGGGLAYYAMEWLPGKNLGALVASEGPLSAPRAVRIVRQLAGALYEAHRRGLVHRDIKPENVILAAPLHSKESVKLIDFGLVFDAREPGEKRQRFTEPGVLLGTPTYFAPEVVVGDPPTAASDVYSLGCLFYFLLTGRAPFAGTVESILAAHVKTEPPPPSQLTNAPIPANVDALVLRCMSKDPSRRPRSGRELLEALQACRAAPVSSSSENEILALPVLGLVEDPSQSVPKVGS